jgi:phage tail-like protein
MTDQVRASALSFDVAWNDAHIKFSEASGLTVAAYMGPRADDLSQRISSIGVPGVHTPHSITLKRGVTSADNPLFRWLAGIATSPLERRMLVISLRDEQRRVVSMWRVRNARPVKIEGPALNATGNDVAIESVEIMHDGIEIVDDDDDR